MIIVNQDKKMIINFDNVIRINVRRLPPNETGYAISIDTMDCLFDRFALYDTEERAKEVLSEIYKKYSDWQTMEMIKDIYLQKQAIAGDKSEYFNVYLMPEK